MKKQFCLIFAFLLCIQWGFSLNIKGKVVDQNGKPLGYVSVYLRNDPYVGTITNEKGFFNLTVENAENDELFFSLVGYKVYLLPIATINPKEPLVVRLEAQNVMLNEVVISSHSNNLSKKEELRDLLQKVRKQMNHDFPSTASCYHIVSDITLYNESQPVVFEEVIGKVIEMPDLLGRGRDSVQLKTDLCKYYDIANVKHSIQNFDVSTLKKKERKYLEKTDLQNLEPHKIVWTLDIIRLFNEYYEDVNNWKVTEKNNKYWILSYSKTHKLLGFYNIVQNLVFLVDKNNLSVQNLSQSITASIKIPFGHKLTPSELDLLNMMNTGNKDLTKYRLKRINGFIKRNVIFRREKTQMVVAEKSMIANIKTEDNKGNEIKVNEKSTVKVLSIQTKNVKPFSKHELNQGQKIHLDLNDIK